MARREYSRHELRSKLSANCDDASELEALLDEYERSGWISDERLVEQVLHTRGSRFGSARVLHELGEKGISGDALGRARRALRETELERAREVWRKRFGVIPLNAVERAKQARFLRSRGFALEMLTSVWRQEESE